MANDKYSIEIELKSKLEEASRAIEQINELKNAANELSKNISSTKTIVNGALYEFGAKLSDLALKIPSVATQAIKAFGEEELAVQKLSAAIRHNGGMVSEVLPIMQELASRMQRITGYADDQIYAMQGVASFEQGHCRCRWQHCLSDVRISEFPHLVLPRESSQQAILEARVILIF